MVSDGFWKFHPDPFFIIFPPRSSLRMDLMFSGHVHAYERSKPVEGTRYIVLGHGGNNEAW